MNDDELGAKVGAALREIYGSNRLDIDLGLPRTPSSTDHHARRPGRWVQAGLAAAVVVVVATVIGLRASDRPTSTQPPQTGLSYQPQQPAGSPTTAIRIRRWDHDGLSFRYPSSWVVTNYRGIPAPTAFPLVFLSEHHLGGPCTSGAPKDRPGSSTCFDGPAVVPEAAVVIRWAEIEQPGSSASTQPGRRVILDHRNAKVQSTQFEVNAAIPSSTNPRAYKFFRMTAAFGRHAPPSDRSAVYAMLESVHIAAR